jgi:hypothetical protein
MKEITKEKIEKFIPLNEIPLFSTSSPFVYFNELINTEFCEIECVKNDDGVITELWFFKSDWNNAKAYRMFHDQDCCEEVYLYDIIGDIEDLIDSKIKLCAEVCSTRQEAIGEIDYSDKMHFTWTFYKFGTMKGYVTLRWFGESNGYYSEKIHIQEMRLK